MNQKQRVTEGVLPKNYHIKIVKENKKNMWEAATRAYYTILNKKEIKKAVY
jgi:hypothetical protein